MWSTLKPLCSLFEWAEVIGIHPYVMAQITEPHALLSQTFGDCEFPFYQFGHQGSDRLAREDVAEALLHAEELIRNQMMTNPAPAQYSEELLYPRMHNLRWDQLWMGGSGRLKSVKLALGNIISMGLYTDEAVEEGAAIVASDPFSEGYSTLATVSVAVAAGITADELHVYFVSADRAGYDRDQCEIRPVKVSISGLVATITFPLILAVKPSNYVKYVSQNLDATAAIYATTVDVYRQTVDQSQSGSLIWEWWDECESPPCSYELTSACWHPVDKTGGYVAPVPAQFDEDTAAFQLLYPTHAAAPDRVIANYISGIPRRSDGKMADTWRQSVAKLATALLPNKTAGCNTADVRLFYYRSMPTRSDNTLEVSQELLDAVSATFGCMGRGAVEAYTTLVMNPRLKVFDAVVG